MEGNANASSGKNILAEYGNQIRQIDEHSAQNRSQRFRVGVGIAAYAVLLVALIWSPVGNKAVQRLCAVLPLAGGATSLRRYGALRLQRLRMGRKHGYYERGITRLNGTWQGRGLTGEEFARKGHLYQQDLNLLGRGSLFELLCTTRSQAGAERLASYLLDTASVEESRARQEAVRELKGATDLREQIALAGDYEFQRCDRRALDAWLTWPVLNVPLLLQAGLLLSSGIGLGLIVSGIAGWIGVWHFVFLLAPFLAFHAMSAAFWLRRVRPRLKVISMLTSEFAVLRQGLAWMQAQQFRSAKLSALVDRLRQERAVTHLQRLEYLMCAVAQREKIPLYGFFSMFAAGTQLTFALERWRAAHQETLIRCLDVWAEFEALNALAGYAYEHPAYIFPEIIEGEARFEAIHIGHPLLADDRCVGNDVLLNDASRFYLVSGSNMAGKSTLLRTLGVSAVLAQAGAPVRAEKARLSCFLVCASIAVSDSLLEGNSKFLAEIARLRDAIACTGNGKPVLFLIDEILSGTNSLDRKIVAESVISELVRRGAVGALSTHDLSLMGIAETPELLGKNVHMESTDPLNPLDFDYRLKPGAARRSNALAIARMIGVCEERFKR